MFKQVFSAMAISAVLLSGTAFAADKTATMPTSATPTSATAATAAAPTGKTVVADQKAEKKEIKKVSHKHQDAKATPAAAVSSGSTGQPAAKAN